MIVDCSQAKQQLDKSGRANTLTCITVMPAIASHYGNCFTTSNCKKLQVYRWFFFFLKHLANLKKRCWLQKKEKKRKHDSPTGW